MTGGDVEGPGGVSSSLGQMNHGDDGGARGADGDWRYPPVVGALESIGLTPHTGVHSEMKGDHLGTGSMSPHI